MATHCVLRFSNAPKAVYFNIVKYIVKYLVRTKYKKLILKSDKIKGIECFVDVNFTSAYNKQNFEDKENIYLEPDMF